MLVMEVIRENCCNILSRNGTMAGSKPFTWKCDVISNRIQ
jgi:hypothetical protein